MSEMYERLVEAAKALPAPPPRRELQVGSRVLAWLRQHAECPQPYPTLGPLLGISIVEAPGLPPERWRLVDADGTVIHEGSIR